MDTSKNQERVLTSTRFSTTIRSSGGNSRQYVDHAYDYDLNDRSDQLDNDFIDRFNLVNIDAGLLRSDEDQSENLPEPSMLGNGMGYGQAFSQNFLQSGFPLWGAQPNAMRPTNDESQTPFFMNNQAPNDTSHFMDRFGFGFSPLINSFPNHTGSSPQPSELNQNINAQPIQQQHFPAQPTVQNLDPRLVVKQQQQQQLPKEKPKAQPQQPSSLNGSQNTLSVSDQARQAQTEESISLNDSNGSNGSSSGQEDKKQAQKPKQQKKEDPKSQDSKKGKAQKIKMSFQEFCSLVGVNNEGGAPVAPSTDDDEEATRSLWIGNIGAAVTEKDLLEEFCVFGEVESIRILHQSFCAFVNFKTVESAMGAKKNLQGQIFDSQYIVINYRKTTADRQDAQPVKPVADYLLNKPSRALWVCNISDTIKEEDLINEFEKYGEVESIRLIRTKSCAFVNFVSVERATDALHGMQAKVLGGLSVKINFAKTQPPPFKGREAEGTPTGGTPSPTALSSSPPTSPRSTSPATAAAPPQHSPPMIAKPSPATQQQSQPPAPPQPSQTDYTSYPVQHQFNNSFAAQQAHIPPTISPYDNYSTYFSSIYNNLGYNPYNNLSYNMFNAADYYNQLTCNLCFQALKDTAFVPCNHLCCSKCVVKIRTATIYKKDKGTKCPFCETTVQKFVPFNAEAFMMQQQQMLPPQYPSQYPPQQHLQQPIGVPNYSLPMPSEHSYRVK